MEGTCVAICVARHLCSVLDERCPHRIRFTTTVCVRAGIPDDWSGLTSLRVVELSGNTRLAGTLPSSLLDLPYLHTIRIQGTQIGGTIPTIGRAPLQSLLLGHNELSGTLPPSLGKLSGLTILGVEGNQLRGPLPDAMFRAMSGLKEMNLSCQHFTGSSLLTVSPFSRFCTRRLVWLRCLISNPPRMTGTLPLALWRMSALKELDVHSNSITGDLSMRDDDTLQSLTMLNLASNQLTGSSLLSVLNSLPVTLPAVRYLTPSRVRQDECHHSSPSCPC